MKLYLFVSFLFIAIMGKAQTATPATGFIGNFSGVSLKYFRYGSTGVSNNFKWQSGIPSTAEPGGKVLVLRIDPDDSAGAGRGPEIISRNTTHFGSYSARIKIPDVKKVQPNTGAVVGYFTYKMDSLYGLSEIDFEWLVADPSIIYIGTWTGTAGNLKRTGRAINLAKGIIYNTIYKEGFTGTPVPLPAAQSDPETIDAIPNYDASTQFYTYGFDWHADRIAWWIVHPETQQKIILWDYKGSLRGIPQHPSYYRMNFWHTNDWPVETNAQSIEPPRQRYALEVDWMSYTPFLN